MKAIGVIGTILVIVFLEKGSALTEVLFTFFFIIAITGAVMEAIFDPCRDKEDIIDYKLYYSSDKDEYRH